MGVLGNTRAVDGRVECHLVWRQRDALDIGLSREDQTELYYVFDGRCRVEAPEDWFDLMAHKAVVFDPDVGHMLHDPFTESCELIELGMPRDAHDPARVIESASSLLSERDCADPETTDR